MPDSMIGHNSGDAAAMLRDNLDEQHRDLAKRARELTATPAPDSITEHAEASALTARVSAINGTLKDIDTAHKAAKAPHLAAGRACDAWKDDISRDLLTRKTALTTTLNDFQRVLAEQERRRREEEATMARQFAERAAAAGDPAASRADDLATSMEQHAAKSDGDMSRVRARSGAMATIRTTTEFRITDEAAIPREFLSVNEAAIRAAIKAGRVVPGIETYERQSTVVR